jgi:hypothetical protein
MGLKLLIHVAICTLNILLNIRIRLRHTIVSNLTTLLDLDALARITAMNVSSA